MVTWSSTFLLSFINIFSLGTFPFPLVRGPVFDSLVRIYVFVYLLSQITMSAFINLKQHPFRKEEINTDNEHINFYFWKFYNNSERTGISRTSGYPLCLCIGSFTKYISRILPRTLGPRKIPLEVNSSYYHNGLRWLFVHFISPLNLTCWDDTLFVHVPPEFPRVFCYL